MKKKIIMLVLCCVMLGMGACGNGGEKQDVYDGEPINVSESSSEAQKQTVEIAEFDYFGGEVDAADLERDYQKDIQANIDAIAAAGVSITDELMAVEKIEKQFEALSSAASTQFEMNQTAQWFYVIWDTELNSLWSRISNQADAQTKEDLLAEQRNWVSMKEEVTLEAIGGSEDNGSMYPVLQYDFWEKITKNRSYILANELAKIKGESFVMPERSSKYFVYVDNQGTGDVYGSLITREGWEGDEAIISVFRVGTLEGTFEDKGNGQLAFSTYSGDVQGIIQMNGWDGASFEVTKCDGDTFVSVGDKFEFDFSF